MVMDSLANNVKSFFGFGEDYDDYDNEMPEAEQVQEEAAPSKKQKIIPLRGQQTNQNKIVVLKPNCFNNSTKVADELKMRRPVIINVGSLDTDEARRVVDFIAGTVYGLGGNMQKVSGGIFIATPAHVDIMGEVLDDSGTGIEWSMF